MTNTEAVNANVNYAPGDVVDYLPFGSSSPRRVRVTARLAEQGNRYEPGFDGVALTLGSPAVWGYDTQIVRVNGVSVYVHS